MRIAVVSHQLGGFDGVSIVAEQWAVAVEKLGSEVVEIAGRFGSRDTLRERRCFAPLWDAFGEEENPSWPSVMMLLTDVDAAIVHNALTLASNPGASIRIRDALQILRLPAIVVHHDPPFEHRARRADERFPLDLDSAVHLAPTTATALGIHLHRGFRPDVLANFVDTGAVSGGDREVTRQLLGVKDDTLLVLHPVTPYRRKRVDRAVEAIRTLEDATGREVVYWLTGADSTAENVDPGVGSYLGLLRRPHVSGYVPEIRDAYAASDFVIMSSDWEGWGLPVLEAAAAGRPVIASRYPLLSAITGAGVQVLDIENIPVWAPGIGAPGWAEMLETNRVAAAAFDVAGLPGQLSLLLRRAARRVR